MGSHPINLAFRFLLELAALVSSGIWGWQQSDGGLRYIPAIGIPVVLAAVWGTFAVPNDPSRSGKAPVATPGIIRLLIELALFAFASWALFDSGYSKLCFVLVAAVFVHYALSYDRIIWLVTKKAADD